MICDSNNYSGLKKEFIEQIKKLKKINILFNNPKQAANFVNTLIKNDDIDEWWSKTYKTKIFFKLKNFVIVEKKNYTSMIVKDLTKNLN